MGLLPSSPRKNNSLELLLSSPRKKKGHHLKTTWKNFPCSEKAEVPPNFGGSVLGRSVGKTFSTISTPIGTIECSLESSSRDLLASAREFHTSLVVVLFQTFFLFLSFARTHARGTPERTKKAWPKRRHLKTCVIFAVSALSSWPQISKFR